MTNRLNLVVAQPRGTYVMPAVGRRDGGQGPPFRAVSHLINMVRAFTKLFSDRMTQKTASILLISGISTFTK